MQAKQAMKKIDTLNNLLKKILYTDEVCVLREEYGNWDCDIGNCDLCVKLAVRLIAQRVKEMEAKVDEPKS